MAPRSPDFGTRTNKIPQLTKLGPKVSIFLHVLLTLRHDLIMPLSEIQRQLFEVLGFDVCVSYLEQTLSSKFPSRHHDVGVYSVRGPGGGYGLESPHSSMNLGLVLRTMWEHHGDAPANASLEALVQHHADRTFLEWADTLSLEEFGAVPLKALRENRAREDALRAANAPVVPAAPAVPASPIIRVRAPNSVFALGDPYIANIHTRGVNDD